MNARFLDYEVMIGAKINEEMPDDLREKITNYIDNNAGPQVRDELREIVAKHCEEMGWEISAKDSIQSSSMLKVDEDGNLEEGSSEDLNTVAGFFKNLGKKKGISVERKIRDITNNTNLQQEIKELSNSIDKNSTSDDKSRVAYKMLDIKVKITINQYEEEVKGLVKEVRGKIKDLEDRSQTESSSLKKTVAKLSSEFERTINVTEQTIDNLKRLSTLDEDEFMDQDYDSRGKYLTHVKSELMKSIEFLKEEQSNIKSKLLILLASQIDLGDHIGIVLG